MMATMRHLKALLVMGLLVVANGTALAQGGGVVGSDGQRSIGVGVQQTLGGISGATFVYDGGMFHVDAILGFASVDQGDDDAVTIVVAGRFFYLLHRAERADFGIGGGVGYHSMSEGEMDFSFIDIEVGAQIRAFLVPNVALSAGLGAVLASGDFDEISFGSGRGSIDGDRGIRLGGEFGLTYYF